MAEFKAESFEELFQGTLAVNWGELIPEDGMMHITGKSVKSKLHSVPDCQGIVKKAVVESMKKTYQKEWFEEDGSIYKIEVAILKDIVTLTIDTTGPGLHKRGYRELAGIAPLKETLAAALILVSKWNSDRVLTDLLCGSGTIPIEAALIGKNIAPGLYRRFTCEDWPSMEKDIWKQVREGAQKSINSEDFIINASDIDGRILKTAKDNAVKAKVDKYINFQKLPMKEFSSKKKYGFVISNPPYGERLGEQHEVAEIYKELGNLYNKLDSWSFYILTSNADFQNYFGEKAHKNRKLYNGKLMCYYYQYINNPSNNK
jgi:putative N6-adenine-specific DNA methylase